MNWFVVCLAAFPIVLSPVMMLVLRVTAEYGKPAGLLCPKTQSWTFLFGDAIALPLAFGAAAMSWSQHPSSVGRHKVVIVFSVVTAVCVSYMFRNADSLRYRRSGNGDRLKSPTKLWHDFIVYPVLTAVLLLIGIPVLTGYFGTIECWIMLAGVALWALFGVMDLMVIKPDPANQHPRRRDTVMHRSI